MQSLYTIDSMSVELNEKDTLQILQKKFQQSHSLFIYLIHFVTEVARFAETDSRQRASKHLPSAEDLNVNTKIAGNELVWTILENKDYQQAVTDTNPDKYLDKDLLKKIYHQLSESEEYKDYIALNSREKKAEKDIIQFIFSALMLPNEEFIQHIEECFINWDDDAEMMNAMVLNFIQKTKTVDLSQFVSPDKMEFAKSLLLTTVAKKEVSMELLKPKLKNWDAERIAALDLIIIQMGICEFLYFDTIPTKVTINEYIDLAKEYSTPQSGQFINGILDNIHKELSAKGSIQKKVYKNSKL